MKHRLSLLVFTDFMPIVALKYILINDIVTLNINIGIVTILI